MLRRKANGFTLIELLITLAVIGIVVTAVYSGFTLSGRDDNALAAAETLGFRDAVVTDRSFIGIGCGKAESSWSVTATSVAGTKVDLLVCGPTVNLPWAKGYTVRVK